MNQLYPIIRRQRRPLQAATIPAPADSVCPHCGRAADEPPAAKAETVKPDAENIQQPTSNIEQPVMVSPPAAPETLVVEPAPENSVSEVFGGSSEMAPMPRLTGETPAPPRKRRERSAQN